MELYIESKYSKFTCDSSILMMKFGYLTSSEYIKKYIERDGLDSFEILFIKHFATGPEAIAYETWSFTTVNAARHPRYTNKSNGGISFYCITRTEEANRKITEFQNNSPYWTNGTVNKRARTSPGPDFYKGFTTSEDFHTRLHDINIDMILWTNGTISTYSKECTGPDYIKGHHDRENINQKQSKAKQGMLVGPMELLINFV